MTMYSSNACLWFAFCVLSNLYSTSLTHSLDHLTGMGRCALQSWRSLAMSQTASAVYHCTRRRFPADGSRFVEDDRADVSIPACHQAGDQSGFWQPGEVLHALVQTLADDVHVQILKHVGHWFCCRCCAAESGSSPIHWAQSRTNVPWECAVNTLIGSWQNKCCWCCCCCCLACKRSCSHIYQKFTFEGMAWPGVTLE